MMFRQWGRRSADIGRSVSGLRDPNVLWAGYRVELSKSFLMVPAQNGRSQSLLWTGCRSESVRHCSLCRQLNFHQCYVSFSTVTPRRWSTQNCADSQSVRSDCLVSWDTRIWIKTKMLNRFGLSIVSLEHWSFTFLPVWEELGTGSPEEWEGWDDWGVKSSSERRAKITARWGGMRPRREN